MTAIALPSFSESSRGRLGRFQGWFDTRSGSINTAYRSQDEIKFDLLTQRWLQDISGISDVDEIIENQNYQEMIAMGWVAVPLILQQLEVAPKQWFFALETITGETLGEDDLAGDVSALSAAWLNWGKARGLR